MNKWKIAYFYTADTKYEQVGKEYLESSLQILNLPVQAYKMPNLGNWRKNVAQKPHAVLNALSDLQSDECLVFLDADSRVLKYPELFDQIPENFEIAFHRLNWNLWYGYNQSPANMELLTGTMFLRNTDNVKQLCKLWLQESMISSEVEQKVLDNLLLENYNVLNYNLPLEYCFIESRPGGLPPLVKCDPVIIHSQASRKLRREL